ncbi:ribosome biogenesis GTPase Der [Microbulbifer thermotolerans]|uniref:GTPase Der n=1 Tax=Microbulbifer thermotolerans TaxID=252514 RepID=A0A143HMX3_MICTH|nr:ribosome biogenesis GTPase Der [Microbulbifer thermotolerans]AMX03085.1 ribosome biogenesis GTPase Der [Microbulbifer thermotolerans]MCX2784372.1 ribosome biogenesis GTPase Der [Microbulbifer thermotolerans]MCX2795996.1 ribosome biogenesis GTPase Der [Microbulbifer thermotolerans]MCX2801885.1 ribosome biogenesis GTPase Der [Microbulbifer thermotolerans]MCX2831469.1 ribosome biogenesis GTPase Der [Microbulbifer thermotolerans]
MLPVIALVGRPNVGKSTLFNRLTKSRDALVANYAGLTRDRKYGEAEIGGRRVILVDTGGISGGEEGIDAAMAQQSLRAIEEADVVLFLVDCRAGLTAADEMIADQLRSRSKPTFLVANKVDGVNPDIALAPFYELGIGEIFPTTATHGRGVRSLMQRVAEDLPEQVETPQSEEATGIKIAIVGRPNVGKSTLVNRLLGEERVVVYDQPGTTRDSIYINYQRDDKPYTIIDTAGVRRRKNIKESVEKFSIVKTLQAVEDANVVVLVIDAREGLVDQDMHLMGSVIQAGRALVVALNKWDGLEADHREYVKAELERRLRFVDFADIHFISALHGTGVGNLYQSIEAAYQSATDKLSTNHLTRILQWAVSEHQPPLVRGHRIKLRYAHAGGQNPPVIVIHGNQTEEVPAHYVRYLEKTYRKALDLHGTPVKIEFRTGTNPYAGRKQKLTDRQKAKKRRLMKFVKKKK